MREEKEGKAGKGREEAVKLANVKRQKACDDRHVREGGENEKKEEPRRTLCVTGQAVAKRNGMLLRPPPLRRGKDTSLSTSPLLDRGVFAGSGFLSHYLAPPPLPQDNSTLYPIYFSLHFCFVRA